MIYKVMIQTLKELQLTTFMRNSLMNFVLAPIFLYPNIRKISSSFGGPKNLTNLNLKQYHHAEHGKQRVSRNRELFLTYTKKTKPFIKNAFATSRLENSFATLTISMKLFFTKMDVTFGKCGTLNLNANQLMLSK